jgi:hypothetical protein
MKDEGDGKRSPLPEQIFYLLPFTFYLLPFTFYLFFLPVTDLFHHNFKSGYLVALAVFEFDVILAGRFYRLGIPDPVTCFRCISCYIVIKIPDDLS